MAERRTDKPNTPESREDRLKAALKANVQKRKAQAKSRARSATNDKKD